MKIQDEVPLPLNPLEGLEEDYRNAVLHLAWDLHTESQERTLLFAFVELLPAEMPPPIDDYDPKGARSSHRVGSKHRLYVRHAVVTARVALDWYLACRIGTAVLPGNDGAIPAAESSGAKRLTLADLGEEPPWPGLISASEDSEAIPFCPQWIHCPRTHHLLPLVEFDRDALWSAREQEEAQGWLEGRLHFDLGEYPEYWGSVHLIAPNPVYREMDTRLQPREPPAESVLVRFEPRAGKTVEGLELSFREKDPWGVTASRHVKVGSALMRMSFDREVNAVMKDVWDPRRGFLKVSSKAYSFLKSIQLNVGAIRKVVVQTPGQSYEVMRSGEPERSAWGVSHKIAAAHSRLFGAHLARQQRRTAEAQGQRWFKDQKEEARALLRSLLNEANSNVLLIDPYFGSEELGEFMLAVGREDIPIRILSSAEILNKPITQGKELENGRGGVLVFCTLCKKPITQGHELKKGDQLLDVLRQIQTHERMNPFEIRVMPGARPAIHDRLLAIDKRIWLLGSSLNEFGSRGTMMLALPDPDAVRGDLENAWKDSEALESWVERRRETRKKAGRENT